MAETQGVWGIEIGQAALKAVRLRYAEAAGQCIAVAFDYVPHPKILSQPDAVPDELIAQALATFLSRNDVKGDRVAISVPGQTALARFIKLPPVEASKVDEIVKYEARQQIPFDLNDVIWDYQSLGGAQEESGLMLEAEVGLFAMKRDQVLNQLRPFNNANVEVDLIQVAPLALYNFLAYDRLGMRLGEDFSPSNEHHILVDMGADNTTLLVSNGVKIWLRNVPIGGNHFTRALTKEMKLTFAKAEHLKCNATKSPDPRAVFQALRPVFNDYVSEIQRSVGYFSSVNRDAKIKMVLGLGNGFKLAGLQKFLQQHLQYPVEKVESFQGLVGDNVLGAPLFQENILGFAVPYGLALQGLQLTQLRTSLLPPEIATARAIRRKKPWAVATAATLLLALGASAGATSVAWKSASPARWQPAAQEADNLDSTVKSADQAYTAAKTEFEQFADKEDKLLSVADHRENWLALFAAINACLPDDSHDEEGRTDPQKRDELNIRSITAHKQLDLAPWFHNVTTVTSTYMLAEDKENPPTGPGYVIRLKGFHFLPGIVPDILHHHSNPSLLTSLQKWNVEVKDENGSSRFYPARRMGITHVALVEVLNNKIMVPDPDAKPDPGPRPVLPRGGLARPPRFQPAPQDGPPQQQMKEIDQTLFTVEFVWRPTTERQMRVFDALQALGLEKSPQTTFAEAREKTEAELMKESVPHHLRRPLSQEEYDEYMKRFVKSAAAADAAGTPAAGPASP
ncbi:MAG: type IV pilus assembly protein PilM [Planctomycetales bacterium]